MAQVSCGVAEVGRAPTNLVSVLVSASSTNATAYLAFPLIEYVFASLALFPTQRQALARLWPVGGASCGSSGAAIRGWAR